MTHTSRKVIIGSMEATALTKAIDRAGGVSQLARALGVRQSVVSNWRKRQVPADRCRAIERATGVSAYELRPDVFGEAANDS